MKDEGDEMHSLIERALTVQAERRVNSSALAINAHPENSSFRETMGKH